MVDDDPWISKLVTRLFSPRGHDVRAMESIGEVLAELDRGYDGLIILDEHLRGERGSDLLRTLRSRGHDHPVIFLSGHGTTALELRALQDGALDFVDKSEMAERLPLAITRAEELLATREPHGRFGLIGASRSMRAVYAQLALALPSTVSVMIRGESGTGKELLARALHLHGPRARAPFVAVNCAGFPPDLLESELFGYERGAFTGANTRKPGRFDQAQGGTLFLDEIGDMPTTLQAKLLRVVQESEYQRLGGSETIRADVRIICATHRDLESETETGRFRADLYFRLARFLLTSPPLRERREDIPALARHFVEHAARKEGRPAPLMSARALEVLQAYDFPGNVRELENTIGYAVLASRGPSIGIADLPLTFLRALPQGSTTPPPEGAEPPGQEWRMEPESACPPEPSPAAPQPDDGTFPTLEEVERLHVARAMDRAGGNKVTAARLLGISRAALYRKLAGESPD